MPQSPSFLLSWRKKDRAQTSPTPGSAPAVEVYIPSRSIDSSPTPMRRHPTRPPSDTPSDNSTRFLRIFKGNHPEPHPSSPAETAQKAQITVPPRASSSSSIMRRPHSPPSHYPPSPERTSALGSPHSLDRPLPPVPPVRPPRPPSLNLDAIELAVPLTPPSLKSRRTRPPHQQRLVSEPAIRHKMPELDSVWEGFMKDVEGDDFTIPPRRWHPSKDPFNFSVEPQRGVRAISDRPRPSLYRAWGSESTPYLAYSSGGQTSDSESEYSDEETNQGDAGFSLSLFPVPPPLPMRRRIPPKPLVLLPTPTIAPLPPSPSCSSGDSTPLATPTTPRSAEPSLHDHSARKSRSPVSILKKPGTSFSARYPVPSPPDTPTTPTTPIFTGVEERPNTSRITSPRLRSAQSVPHLQKSLLPASNTHRNVSSDTSSMGNRERVPDRTNGRQLVRSWPLLYSGFLQSRSIRKRSYYPPRPATWSGVTQFNHKA